ncbi:DoxX family protein [Pseudomonas sp. NPDC089734]|uniref:DoxX family protein n=1 Tax=Pseudomonas sp. NPDC089734 TaxID=3364469 RepID=UPI003822A0D2
MTHTKEDYCSFAGRVLLSLLFLYGGLGKIVAPAATMTYIANAGLPFPVLAYAGSLLVELGFASALLLGYRTKLVAAGMALFTLVTALVFHANFAEKMQLINFLKNIAICGGLLQVMAGSPGSLSLDAWRQNRS